MRQVRSETASQARPRADRAPAQLSATEASSFGGMSTNDVVALQRFAGNRAVSSVMRSVAQRVPMTSPDSSETLYNQTNAAGEATAKKYGGGGKKYDMTRNGDTGVTVTVRIRLVSQSRNTVDPTAPGSPAGTPPLGRLLDSPTEIPVTDPDNRRAWATDMAGKAVAIWNGRLTLTEEPEAAAAPAAAAPAAPAPAGGVADAGVPAAGVGPAPAPIPPPKKLPVTFTSVPSSDWPIPRIRRSLSTPAPRWPGPRANRSTRATTTSIRAAIAATTA